MLDTVMRRYESKRKARDTPIIATCPSCKNAKTEYIGPIPPSNTFAGVRLAHEIGGGGLYACRLCHLYFRHPVLDKSALDKLYRSGNPDNWQPHGLERMDWRIVKNWLAGQKEVRRILDVGCFDGRFLDYLGEGYERLGIEIHVEASNRARARGINIVGNDFEQISSLDLSVDVAFGIDVIEHTHDPKGFLASLAACVRPGGFVAVTTGNTDAATWRLMGSRYWYCHIAEHITFINPAWAATVASQLGLELVSTYFFSHSEVSIKLRRRIYETFANLLYRLSPRLIGTLRRLGIGGINVQDYPGLELTPPYWMTARDHMLLVFRKIGSK